MPVNLTEIHPMNTPHNLSRREREIMDVVFAKGQATVSEVLETLKDPPSYSAVRALMRILEEKGHLRHRESQKKIRLFAGSHTGEGSQRGSGAGVGYVFRRIARAGHRRESHRSQGETHLRRIRTNHGPDSIGQKQGR